MFSFRTIAFALTLAFSMLALTAASVASAKGGNGVRVRGTCTQSSTAKLKLGREDGRIEVEFEVDQNRTGVPWKVTLRRNGTVVATKTVVTRGPSGSFSVRRIVLGAHGAVAAVATRASGERCVAHASI